MLLIAAASAAHHEPNAMHHVMDARETWEILPFLGWEITLVPPFTKYNLLMLLAAGIICLIYIPLGKRIQVGGAPKGAFWNFFEALLTFIRDNVAKPYIPHHTDHYVPFLWTMFLFVLT